MPSLQRATLWLRIHYTASPTLLCGGNGDGASKRFDTGKIFVDQCRYTIVLRGGTGRRRRENLCTTY